MIIDSNGRRIPAGMAARRLVYMFGSQLDGMGSDEWDHVLDPEKLTSRDESEILRQISLWGSRVRKLLRPHESGERPGDG